jgi:hypothetical protein
LNNHWITYCLFIEFEQSSWEEQIEVDAAKLKFEVIEIWQEK